MHFAEKTKFSHLLSGALLSFTVASMDEGIQIVSGRGDQVSDIFIDVSGYLSAYLVGALILYVFCWRKESKKEAASD